MTQLSPREQVVEAAAELFVTCGFAGTSTRAIAERVGIRQASLYYHFPNKEQILAVLLERSIRPTIEKIKEIEVLADQADAHPDTLLYLLVTLDVTTLAEAPHNAGMLARLPEVRALEVFERFAATHAELTEAYDRFAERVATGSVAAGLSGGRDGFTLGTFLVHFVETVISIRKSGRAVDETTVAMIASSCLRLCGASQERIEAASAVASELIESLV